MYNIYSTGGLRMKYVCVFRTILNEIIHVDEVNYEPKYAEGDFVTIEPDEVYRVERVVFNHDINNKRIFVYVEIRDLEDHEDKFIDAMLNAKR